MNGECPDESALIEMFKRHHNEEYLPYLEYKFVRLVYNSLLHNKHQFRNDHKEHLVADPKIRIVILLNYDVFGEFKRLQACYYACIYALRYHRFKGPMSRQQMEEFAGYRIILQECFNGIGGWKN